MSLENFFGLEEGESQGGAEASEKFREQMRKNAKAIKAMTGNQAKQKKKEDKLAAILVKFLQDQSKGSVVFLVVKLLQQNVPGAFILAILAIADPALEKELRLDFKQLAAAKAAALPEGAENQAANPALEAGSSNPATSALINFAGDSKLPENVKAELNAWGEAILAAGLMMSSKTLETVLTPKQKLKSIVLDLIDYSLAAYFDRHGIDLSNERVRQFALLSIQSVLIKLRDTAREKTDAEIIETPEGSLEDLEEETSEA